MPIASIVEWDKVWDVVFVSLVAGIGVTAIFAIAVHGATRAMDMRRDGRAAEAGAYGALAAVALAVTAAAVAFGIVVMTTK